MVLYDDKKWLCRLITTAFTIEDDSGVCEKVLKEKPYLEENESGTGDTSEGSSEGSFDIRDGADLGHRRRSNTAIRLEKMERQRKALNSTQFVRVRHNEVVRNELTFVPNEDYKTKHSEKIVTNALNIEKLLKTTPDPYVNYAKFEASCHPSLPYKKIAIFVTFLPPRVRAYPLKVAIVSSAKVVDLIGLLLWIASKSYSNLKLKTVHQYNLQISDEDGEWDGDFPPLDHQELIGKFAFTHLALVPADGQKEMPKQTYNYTFLLPSNFGELKMQFPPKTTLKDALTAVFEKSGGSSKFSEVDNYHLEKLGNAAAAFKDLTITLSDTKNREFCVVRNGAKSVQAARASIDVVSSKPGTEIPLAGIRCSEIYPVTVTGRFNRVKSGFCVIWGRERMDLEFQTKTKSYPFTQISGVKLDLSKNRLLVSLGSPGSGSQSAVGSYYSGSSHLQLSAPDINITCELHNRLKYIIESIANQKTTKKANKLLQP